MAYALYYPTSPQDTTDGTIVPSYLPASKFKQIAQDNNSVTYTNTDAPIDQPATMKLLSRGIDNIYNITAALGISRNEKAPLTRGVHLETSYHEVIKKEDQDDTAAPRYKFPGSMKILIDWPVDDLFDQQALLGFVNRGLGTIMSHTARDGGIVLMNYARKAIRW